MPTPSITTGSRYGALADTPPEAGQPSAEASQASNRVSTLSVQTLVESSSQGGSSLLAQMAGQQVCTAADPTSRSPAQETERLLAQRGDSIRALSDTEAFFTFNPVGRFLSGAKEGAVDLIQSPVVLAKEVFLTAKDSGGHAATSLYNLGAEHPLRYGSESALFRSLEQDGPLMTAGKALAIPVNAVAAPLRALYQGDAQAIGRELPGLLAGGGSGSMLRRLAGGSAEASAGLRAATQATEAAAPSSVSLFGFGGTAKVRDLMSPDSPHPYVVTGHVGYSIDGGKTIYGFGPHMPEGMTGYEAVQALRRQDNSYPGIVTDDTAVFRQVSEQPARQRTGQPQQVIEQKIPVTPAQYEAIKAAHDNMGVNRPNAEVRYAFPGRCEGSFNCATFPSTLGIPLPEPTGHMDRYMPQLEQLGEPWKP